MLRNDRCQGGQAAVEFIVVTMLVGLALFWPWIDGRSVVDWLLVAFVGLGDSLRFWWTWI